MRITTVAVSIAVALALALAACGGGPPDPAKVYAEAGEKMAALASFHVALEFQEDGESGSGEIDLVLPDRFQATFGSNRGWEFTTIGIGEQFYTTSSRLGPDWFVWSEEALGEPVPQVAAFNAALLTRITDLTYIDEKSLDGAPVHHLQGSLAPDVLALVDGEDIPAENVKVELWVGTEDSLVHRYHLVLPDGTTTLTLSRFGEAVNIVAPVNPRTAEELARLFEAPRFEAPRFETPEQVKEAITALSTEEQDCLRQALGDAAFAELKSGTRTPTAEEIQKGGECIARE